MRFTPALATVLLIAAATPALADFAMAPQDAPAPAADSTPPRAPKSAPPPAPPHAPAATHPLHSDRPFSHHHPARRHEPRIAQGFGNHIPLSFAVRQIVPASHKILFRPGAKPATLVDWNGGKPWKQVLRSVLTPLHLHADIDNTKVAIAP